MSSNFVKAIRSQEGFSLVQVLVSVAVMAVVMAGTATMMQQMGRSQKTQDSRASYMTLSGAIRSQLLRKETCLASLTAGVPNLTTVTDTSSHDITVFVDPMTVAANANLPDYRLLVNFIRLTEFRPFGVMTGTTRYHFANLEMSVSTEKLSSDVTSGQDDRFQFGKSTVARVIFESNPAGVAQSCYAIDGAVDIEQLIESLCTSMGLVVSGNSCAIDPRVREIVHAVGSCPSDYLFNGTSATGTAICVPKSHLTATMGSCPGGHYVSGIAHGGTVQCSPLPTSPVAAGSCPPGQSMTGITASGPTCAPSSPLAGFVCHGSPQHWVSSFDSTGKPICSPLLPEIVGGN